ncbi:MAG: ABC transporter substrate-binding protein, partial [Alphaproteobacteria bacterium]
MRRSLTLLAGLLVALTTTPVSAQQPERVWRHGLSLFGAVKYPPGFTRTDYVNPNAPKGGTARLSTDGTFDSFNVTLVRGSVAPIANYLYMPLFEDVMDEVSTAYGAIADAVSHPDDFSAVTYRIDPRAKWHDGRPITPEDVVWTMEQVKKHDPRMAFYYRNVVKVEQTGEREVTFSFDVPGNREKPLIIGQLNIMPKHWWTGTDAQGRQRDISQTTLEPPLGSGPYRIASVSPGRSITLERVRDWWAAGLPIYVGKHNFDEIRIEFFRDDFVELEA